VKLCGKYHVRLDDGTCWGIDRTDEEGAGLEWILRYGTTEELVKHRMSIASIVASYKALLWKKQKDRNRIVSDLREALETPLKESEDGR
jgi:hypothetical protein